MVLERAMTARRPAPHHANPVNAPGGPGMVQERVRPLPVASKSCIS